MKYIVRCDRPTDAFKRFGVARVRFEFGARFAPWRRLISLPQGQKQAHCSMIPSGGNGAAQCFLGLTVPAELLARTDDVIG
jgi:hypothetical protein